VGINMDHTSHADMAAYPSVNHPVWRTLLLSRPRSMELAPSRCFLPCCLVRLRIQVVTIRRLPRSPFLASPEHSPLDTEYQKGSGRFLGSNWELLTSSSISLFRQPDDIKVHSADEMRVWIWTTRRIYLSC
jgi:hypothetical protein